MCPYFFSRNWELAINEVKKINQFLFEMQVLNFLEINECPTELDILKKKEKKIHLHINWIFSVNSSFPLRISIIDLKL